MTLRQLEFYKSLLERSTRSHEVSKSGRATPILQWKALLNVNNNTTCRKNNWQLVATPFTIALGHNNMQEIRLNQKISVSTINACGV